MTLLTFAVSESPKARSVVSALADWLRSRRSLRQSRQRLAQCSDYELGCIAKDIGLSPLDLRHIMKLGPNSEKLLSRRMTVLHLDADALAASEMSVLRDLQRVCSACDRKGRCQKDLARRPKDSAWRQYCPNEGTLAALQSGVADGHDAPSNSQGERACARSI